MKYDAHDALHAAWL